MQIIISPAKKMRTQPDIMEETGLPCFLEDADKIRGILKSYSRQELKALIGANDDITEVNYRRYQDMDLRAGLTPAVLSYVGIQYQTMAPEIFTDSQWRYVQRHLNILSGFYGILKACDGVVPYRLEMQAKLGTEGNRNLFEYWGSRLYEELTKEDHVIVNLASKEYSKAVEPYLKPEDLFLTCVFGEETEGRVKVKATAAKMARGEMVRFIAERGLENQDDLNVLKEFDRMNYRYRKEYSSEREYVFVKQG